MGQRLMHWPQLMQTTSPSGRSPKVVISTWSLRFDGLEDADLLQVDAGAHAAPAADALVHVAHDRVARGVDLGHRGVGVAEAELGDAVLLGQGLQLAVAVALAASSTRRSARESSSSSTWRRARRTRAAVGVDRHLVGDREGAGRPAAVRWPSTSTTQMRQTPATSRSGWLQSVGMWMPMLSAASRMVDAEGHLGLDAVDGDGDRGADGVGARGRDHAPCLLRQRRAVQAGRH